MKKNYFFMVTVITLVLFLFACSEGDSGTGDDSISFLVTTPGEWKTALDSIAGGGDNQKYTITVNGTVPVPGRLYDNFPFGLADGISVTLKGNGKIFLNSIGYLVGINNRNL